MAHYAAAKAGLLGLTNVIAIEGAAHGVLANAVLPFGYSRMVADTVAGREQVPQELAFLDAMRPELVVQRRHAAASRAPTAPPTTTMWSGSAAGSAVEAGHLDLKST